MEHNKNIGSKAFMDHLPWSGARLGLVLSFFIGICTQSVGLYYMTQREDLRIFQTRADTPNDQFVRSFWNGDAFKQIKALALQAEATKLNLEVDDAMIDSYTQNMKLFQDGEEFSLEKYNQFLKSNRISASNLREQIRVRMLAEIMEKIVNHACNGFSLEECRLPSKVIVDLIYLKHPPQTKIDPIRTLNQSIRNHSALVLEPNQISGQVLAFDTHDEIMKRIFQSAGSTSESRMNYLQTLTIPIQKIIKHNAHIDDDPAAHVLFQPDGTVFQSQGRNYIGKADRVQSSHIKNEISFEDMQLLGERASGYQGSLEELHQILSQLHKNGYNPHAIKDTYSYECVYDLNSRNILNPSDSHLFLLTAKEGQVLMWYDDKPCIAYIREVIYDSSSDEMTQMLKNTKLSHVIIQNMCTRFARSSGVF